MKLPHISPEKVRRELIVTSLFACRMGFDPSDVEVGGLHADSERPDAVLARGTFRRTLELTMADPVGSGAVPAELSKDSILNGGIRGAHDRLNRAFFARPAAQRPLSLDVWFRESADEQGNRCVSLPRGEEIDRFVDELVQLSSDIAVGTRGPLQPGRRRNGRRIYDLADYPLLFAHCRSVEVSAAPAGHPGMIATSLNSVWAVDADICAILRKKARKPRRADWVIVFEWDVPGALPDHEDLPPIDPMPFERIFVLHPASPRWIFEWSHADKLWGRPIEYKNVAQREEEGFVREVCERWASQK